MNIFRGQFVALCRSLCKARTRRRIRAVRETTTTSPLLSGIDGTQGVLTAYRWREIIHNTAEPFKGLGNQNSRKDAQGRGQGHKR